MFLIYPDYINVNFSFFLKNIWCFFQLMLLFSITAMISSRNQEKFNGKMNKTMLLELKNRLSQIISIEKIDIHKLYNELLSFFSESENNYIIRRHKELHKEKYKNKEIYSLLTEEIKNHLFIGRNLSERQIKRIIYKEQ